MQAELQHTDPHADPHDAIAAQLRDLAPRLAHDPLESDAAPAAASEPVDAPPLHDTPLRDIPLNDNIGDIRDLKPRAGVGRSVALIVCAGVAAVAAWHAYGEEARQRLAHLVPQLLAAMPAPARTIDAAEPQTAAAEIAAPQPAADPASAQEATATPATPAQSATAPSASAVEAPPVQAALPPELAQSIETMTRDIASLKQTVERLQAGQQQLGTDVANVTEKVTEHEARRKPAARAAKPTSAPRPQRASARGAPPHNLGTLSSHSPPPAYSQAPTATQGTAQGIAQREAYIQPPAPTQLPPPPGDTSVPRPPMPLR